MMMMSTGTPRTPQPRRPWAPPPSHLCIPIFAHLRCQLRRLSLPHKQAATAAPPLQHTLGGQALLTRKQGLRGSGQGGRRGASMRMGQGGV